MEKFIGTKIVQAEPMTRGEHWGSDAVDAIMNNAGDAMEKAVCDTFNDAGYRVIYEDGYQSWSPKETFEKAYRRTDGMSFGLALEACKMGKRIARKGWNGKNMSVAYQKGYPDGIPCNENTAKAWGMEVGELFKCRPYLQMRCADGSFQMWTASQSDILADDWYIAED